MYAISLFYKTISHFTESRKLFVTALDKLLLIILYVT